ncbi:hypothetical protein TEA_016606 [Camellia sinensis var. sinensis]|uniref:Uncharacterized protein n=1 Tax=Camellia sinensis var. sinensis TaxID=542762 RepID=A0A4S4EUN5_CAMSN|nr:hypothetical protein TEA_016606 [Camellia sinensis var. sinensis]
MFAADGALFVDVRSFIEPSPSTGGRVGEGGWRGSGLQCCDILLSLLLLCPVPNSMANPTMTSKNEWSSGLFDCFSDTSSCTTWYLLLYGCAHICAPLYSCGYRSKLRNRYSLESTPCNDFLVHFCCEKCALCQEYRELQNRGFNMSVG